MAGEGGNAKAKRPAEERAEQAVARVVEDGSRMLRKIAGRVREEVEDIVAEARSIHDRPSGRDS